MGTLNIPESDKERVIVIGAGFAGLNLVNYLSKKKKYQVVLIDKNNFHQFQPLYYQVAMAGLEPSSIVFPLRKLYQNNNDVHIRVAKFQEVDTQNQTIYTSKGTCKYDKLIFAVGAKTNYYGNKNIENASYSLKSIGEALHLRNAILNDYENAVIENDYDARQRFIDIVIVGGGPTGVELAGALAEMKKFILPKDYNELNAKEVDIYLIQASDKLLNGMSETASQKAEEFLLKLGVKVIKEKRVESIKDNKVFLSDQTSIEAGKVIWAAGITANVVNGLPNCEICGGGRIKIDQDCRVVGYDNIFAIGDLAYMSTGLYPKGHPQVAQVAIQQGNYLGKFLMGKSMKGFEYKDKGSMATVGRNKAVVDLPYYQFSGFFAWVAWLFVHLAALIGARNKVIVMLNWVWNYITYDQSLRLIIKADDGKLD